MIDTMIYIVSTMYLSIYLSRCRGAEANRAARTGTGERLDGVRWGILSSSGVARNT